MSTSRGHAKQRSSLRVLDVEERRREVQVRFRDVRRPERAAVADRLPSESVHVVAVADGSRSSGVREAPGLVGVEQRERVVQATSGRLVEQLVAVRVKSTVQSPIRQHEVDVRLRVARSQM